MTPLGDAGRRRSCMCLVSGCCRAAEECVSGRHHMAAVCQSVWLLLWIWVWLSETKNIRVSMNDDVLVPYLNGHGPAHSHRHVRDCQPVVHGNVTYETWPSSTRTGAPVAESSVFVSDVPGSAHWVYGHMTVVRDPLRTVSVLEPGGPGGCGINRTALVEETAEAAGCLYAQNGGFFNMLSGQCLGNVVSDGRLVRDSSGVQNAQFGIRRDGSMVFGYLSEEDVLDQVNPFVQLVSGVVWLLRNGQVYINQSLEAECARTQKTGNLQYFVDVVSGRTAVGHDKDGNLILFHIDGQTTERGMNLWEVAEFLKKYGVINAINLDGGGSSTYVINGSLASYPSDHCIPDGRWRCARQVSTVLCVHLRRCQEDCSGHGDCVDGRCRCQEGWRGTACDALVCQPLACTHGVCTPDGCVCDAGWRGHNCSQECMPGFYGDGCNQTCTCANGGLCDPVHGRCTCPPGFHGDSCQQECAVGFYGLSCSEECHCEDLCPCDPVTGACTTSLYGERNSTVHRAGHCLAKQMFTTWRREEEAHQDKPYLADRSWLIITVTLGSLLLVSLLGHLMRACGGLGVTHHLDRHDYSYVPLNDINRGRPHAGVDGEVSRPGTAGFELDDSEDEVFSTSLGEAHRNTV